MAAKAHKPHLKTFRDGWRTLRLFSDVRAALAVPDSGQLLILLGLIGFALSLPQVAIFGHVRFSLNTQLCASLAIIIGFQAVMFALGTKIFAIRSGLMPEDPRVNRFFKRFTLERGLILGAAAMLLGLILILFEFNRWRLSGFGNLDYEKTTRWIITAATCIAVGFQTILSSFFTSILGMPRK
jgi:hypothetical protein